MNLSSYHPFRCAQSAYISSITGQSEEARAIELQLSDIEGRRQESHTLSRRPLVNEISDWAVAANHDDWDGDESAAAIGRSVKAARTFATYLPAWVPDPSVAIDRDGEVELYWMARDRRSSLLIVLTSKGDGRASYVSPIRRYFGTWKLEKGRLPDDFIDSLQVLDSVGFEEAPKS